MQHTGLFPQQFYTPFFLRAVLSTLRGDIGTIKGEDTYHWSAYSMLCVD